MSTSKKIVGSFALASLLWLGTTAYISNNVETYLNDYVKNSNKIYSANGLKISLDSFEKGFLNSKASLSLDITDPELKKELQEILKLPMHLNYDIENGPLLFKNGFAMGASRMKSSTKLSDILQESEALKKVLKEEIVFDNTMLIDFSQQMHLQSHSNEIVLQEDGDTFTIAPIEVTSDMDIETLKGTFTLEIPSIKGELANKGEVLLSHLTMDGDIKKVYDNGFYLGDFKMSLEKMDVNNPTLPIKLKGVNLTMGMNINQTKNELIDTSANFQIDLGKTELPKEYAFLKNLSFDYGLNGTKLKGWMGLQSTMKNVQEKQQALLNNLRSVKTMEEQQKIIGSLQNMQSEMMEQLASNIADLLVKNRSKLYANADIIDTQSQKSRLSFDVNYVGDETLPKGLEALATKFQQEFLNWIKLNINLNLKKSLVNNLPPQLQQQVQMAMLTGMIKDNNSSYSFSANYVPKKLMVNGEDKTEMIGLLQLMLTGEGQ